MAALLILGALALCLATVALRRSPALLGDAVRSAIHRFVELTPRMIVGLLLAGFVGKLIPSELVAGVIGHKKFIYDLWGDAVNTASRMESHGSAGAIQITGATHRLIKDDFICEPRGKMFI